MEEEALLESYRLYARLEGGHPIVAGLLGRKLSECIMKPRDFARTHLLRSVLVTRFAATAVLRTRSSDIRCDDPERWPGSAQRPQEMSAVRAPVSSEIQAAYYLQPANSSPASSAVRQNAAPGR